MHNYHIFGFVLASYLSDPRTSLRIFITWWSGCTRAQRKQIEMFICLTYCQGIKRKWNEPSWVVAITSCVMKGIEWLTLPHKAKKSSVEDLYLCTKTSFFFSFFFFFFFFEKCRSWSEDVPVTTFDTNNYLLSFCSEPSLLPMNSKLKSTNNTETRAKGINLVRRFNGKDAFDVFLRQFANTN